MMPERTHLVSHGMLLDELLAAPAPAQWSRPFGEFQDRRTNLLKGEAGAPGAMWPGDIIRALADAVPDDTIVTTASVTAGPIEARDFANSAGIFAISFSIPSPMPITSE